MPGNQRRKAALRPCGVCVEATMLTAAPSLHALFHADNRVGSMHACKSGLVRSLRVVYLLPVPQLAAN